MDFVIVKDIGLIAKPNSVRTWQIHSTKIQGMILVK